MAMRSGGKTEALLSQLAWHRGYRLPRETLLHALWPGGAAALDSQSLNSLIYSLGQRLGDEIGGAPPVVHGDGYFRLNVEAGVSVDVACFEALASDGDRHARPDARPRHGTPSPDRPAARQLKALSGRYE